MEFVYGIINDWHYCVKLTWNNTYMGVYIYYVLCTYCFVYLTDLVPFYVYIPNSNKCIPKVTYLFN